MAADSNMNEAAVITDILTLPYSTTRPLNNRMSRLTFAPVTNSKYLSKPRTNTIPSNPVETTFLLLELTEESEIKNAIPQKRKHTAVSGFIGIDPGNGRNKKLTLKIQPSSTSIAPTSNKPANIRDHLMNRACKGRSGCNGISVS